MIHRQETGNEYLIYSTFGAGRAHENRKAPTSKFIARACVTRESRRCLFAAMDLTSKFWLMVFL